MSAKYITRKQLRVKALEGKGGKLGEHWEWLYPQLKTEFRRLRLAGAKFSLALLTDTTRVMIQDNDHEIFNNTFRLHDKPFCDLITAHRLQDFVERCGIVYRKHK